MSIVFSLIVALWFSSSARHRVHVAGLGDCVGDGFGEPWPPRGRHQLGAGDAAVDDVEQVLVAEKG